MNVKELKDFLSKCPDESRLRIKYYGDDGEQEGETTRIEFVLTPDDSTVYICG